MVTVATQWMLERNNQSDTPELLNSWTPISCSPTYWQQWQLKTAHPAVSLTEADLQSLCSKIREQPSTAVLIHMKQSCGAAGGAGYSTHERRWHVCTHKGRSHYDALPGTMVGWIVISMKVCCRQHFWNNYQPFPVRQAINYTTDKSVIRFPFTIRMNYVYRESFSTKYHKTNKIENNLIVSKAIFLFVKMQPQTCPEP